MLTDNISTFREKYDVISLLLNGIVQQENLAKYPEYTRSNAKENLTESAYQKSGNLGIFCDMSLFYELQFYFNYFWNF
jgi:hypothetical protein